jgi:hypothetical protein
LNLKENIDWQCWKYTEIAHEELFDFIQKHEYLLIVQYRIQSESNQELVKITFCKVLGLVWMAL